MGEDGSSATGASEAPKVHVALGAFYDARVTDQSEYRARRSARFMPLQHTILQRSPCSRTFELRTFKPA
jgi:hypothetical protein